MINTCGLIRVFCPCCRELWTLKFRTDRMAFAVLGVLDVFCEQCQLLRRAELKARCPETPDDYCGPIGVNEVWKREVGLRKAACGLTLRQRHKKGMTDGG